MEHKTNSKQIILYTILLIVILVAGILMSGCAVFSNAKRYEMRPSPCACNEEFFIELENLV